jgi:hypothetical protein
MTSAALVSLIFALCSPLKGYEAERLACMESYTNCAVVEDGKILSLTEFKDVCGYKPTKIGVNK